MIYLADIFMWCWCWLAYAMERCIPITRRGDALDRLKMWLLPFAGFYAYHDPEWGSTWRWSERGGRI